MDGRVIARDGPAYVIAEIGHNHQGDVDKAKALVRAARECGANAVKLQKRDNARLYTRALYNAPYDNEHSFGRTYGEHREALELSAADWLELREFSREEGITLFGTVFDEPSAAFLHELDLPAFKIASGDLTNTPLLRHVAALGRPIFLSTGGGTMEDVERAVDTILPLNAQLCVMQCTAAYPCEVEELNLGVIESYRERFPDLVIGLSDHQSGIAMSLVGYMLGARVIEKHFTLNHAWKGSDHAFSLMPEGMRRLVRDLHRVPDAGRRRREAPARERGAAAGEDGQEVGGHPRPAGRTHPDGGRSRSSIPGRQRPPALRARQPGREEAHAATHGRAGTCLGRRRAGRRARRRSRSVTSLSEIRLVVFDFDGVFSDNRVWTNDRGEESVACFRGDSAGLRRLDEVGVDYFILTSETNDAVPARARKIRIECVRGIEDKLPVLREELERRGVSLGETAYVGNDINDTECLASVGLPVVPADAWAEVMPLAGMVLTRAGGHGCVREFCDAVWNAKRAVAA